MSDLRHDLERAAGTPRTELDLEAVHVRATARTRRHRALRTTGVTSAALIIVFASVFAFSQRDGTTNVEPTVHPGANSPTGNTFHAKPGWAKLPPAPIAARRNPVTVWTGSEVLVIGGFTGQAVPTCPMGVQRPLCDPSTGSAGPLGDGAAYDPATNVWHQTAPLPSGFATGQSTGSATSPVQVVDGKVYVVGWSRSSRQEARLAVYDPATDRWVSRTPPKGSPTGWSLTGFDHKLIAYAPVDTEKRVADQIFDPKTGHWAELPADPFTTGLSAGQLAKGVSRQLFDVGQNLYEFVSISNGTGESETRVARFDGSGWKQLSATTQQPFTGTWVDTDGKFTMANPGYWSFPESQRPKPKGPELVTFDPATETFQAESVTDEVLDRAAGFSVGAIADGRSLAIMSNTGTALQDQGSGLWSVVGNPMGQRLEGFSATWAGNQLFVWGGTLLPESEHGKATMSRNGWIWTPSTSEAGSPSNPRSTPSAATRATTTTTETTSTATSPSTAASSDGSTSPTSTSNPSVGSDRSGRPSRSPAASPTSTP